MKDANMIKIVRVEGMMCAHCEEHIKKELEAVPGIIVAIPNKDKNEVILHFTEEIDAAFIKEAVKKSGYKYIE